MSDTHVSPELHDGGRPPPTESVAAVREAARRIVRELGLLSERLDASGCTLAQCHALVEIERAGVLGPGELAARLHLDRSTVSRTVTSLVETGLVEVVPDPQDRRRKPIRLTPRGRVRLTGVHRRADGQVAAALALLPEAERETARRGLSLYADSLRRARFAREIRIRTIRPRDDAALARVIRRVSAEFGALGDGFSSQDSEVAEMSAAYGRRRHAYFVAARSGTLLGGAGIGPLLGGDAETCELRKMYLVPEARGLGVGSRLLERCLEAARRRGFRRCYLETMAGMEAARGLYERNGFEPLPAPRGRTGHSGCNRWYAREL